MPYSIQATPPAYSSLHDDLIYTVQDSDKVDDPTTYPNFKFIGDVYVAGNLVARIKKVPDPATGIGVFNVGQVIRNYLATTFNPTAGALVAQTMGAGEFSLSVVMKFGEEYAYADTFDIIVDDPRIFFNNYNGRLKGLTSSLTPFLDKVASNQPSTAYVFSNSAYNFLSYFPTTTNPVSVVVTPSGGGSGFTTSFTPANAFDLQILNLSPVALNAVHAGTITGATTSYTVRIGSQTWTFKIICESIYQPFTIHFLNQYGGFESKIFSKVSRQTIAITPSDFGKLRYTIDSSGVVSYKNANGVYNEARSVYSKTYLESAALNSDLLNDQEYAWLQDLLLSPMIYIEDGGYLFPVVITDTDYEPKKVVNDDLTNLTINIQYGIQLNAQFR